MVNLNGMKRSTLQKLAKQHGIKANMKTDKIIAALQEVLNSSQVSTVVDSSSACDSLTETSCDEEIQKESTPIQSKKNNKRKLNETFEKSPTKNDDSQLQNSSMARTSRSRRTRSSDNRPSIEPADTSTVAAKRTRFAPKTSLENQIMEEVRRNIQEEEQKTSGNSKGSCIPRFQVTGVTVPGVNKTPGQKKWDKVHQKNFNKFESIDDYERRRQDRAQRLLGSNKGKQGRSISRLARPVNRRKASDRVSEIKQPNFMSPMSRKILEKSKNKPSADNSSSNQFKPVLSTSKMNLNFTKKASRLATPKKVTIISDKPNTPRVSKTPHKPSTPGPNRSSHKKKAVISSTKAVTPARKIATPSRKIATPARKMATPAKATDTPSSKKPSFDLQESLKKPLSWVPHKGPLKTAPQPKKSNFRERMKSYKQPQVGTRESRRTKAKENRQDAKHRQMMSRRGVNI